MDLKNAERVVEVGQDPGESLPKAAEGHDVEWSCWSRWTCCCWCC